MNRKTGRARVCILSSVHRALDSRIYHREACSLDRAGYQVTIIAIHQCDEERAGIRIRGLPNLNRWKRPWLWLLLLRLAVSSQADIFHFHDPELLLVAPWIRLLTGKPIIYDIHEVYSDFIAIKRYLAPWLRRLLSWAFTWGEPLLARLNSGLIFADGRIAERFDGIQRPKAILFNYPTHAFVRTATASAGDREEQRPFILHVGMHERSRGIHVMIEAFCQVQSEVPEARLLLVGPFEPLDLEQRVRQDLERRGIASAVTLTGRVPFGEVGRYLQQASVGWIALQPVPKYQKNIPTKLFEYMAYGLPVVSSDLHSVRPFLQDEENGYLVKADDPSSHARGIARILRHPQTAHRMGKRNREAVRSRYNWEVAEKDLLAVYDALLS